jgi:hypothetical protein
MAKSCGFFGYDHGLVVEWQLEAYYCSVQHRAEVRMLGVYE